MVGAADDEVVTMPKGRQPPGGATDSLLTGATGGTISEKGLINAFKRAK